MIIEVTGVGTWNKGAELMLVAIHRHFAQHHPEVRLAVNQWFGGYLERARYGLLQKADIHKFGRSRLALGLMPASFRKTYGIVKDRDIDAILDASGFAFGDQHPPERTVAFAHNVEAARRAGKKVILLPQALGPFDNAQIRDAFARIVSYANLVFVRDQVSLTYTKKVVGDAGHIRLAPDFTNLVKPDAAARGFDTETVCIVPNQRMIEKADSPQAAAGYIALLCACITAADDAGLAPVLLLHSSHDAALVRDIFHQLGRELPVLREEDPVQLKRRLGASHLVVASRFHALVSALSQGVPCIATSWSHKYEMLFGDYECEDMILPITSSEDRVRQCIKQVTGPSRPQRVARLKACADRLVRQVGEMWKQVDRELGLRVP